MVLKFDFELSQLSYKYFLIYIFIFACVFANSNFTIVDNNNFSTTISFNIGDTVFNEEDGYHKILSDSKGFTDNIGEPEIPSYAFNYAVDRSKEYAITYNVNDFELFENMSYTTFYYLLISPFQA